MYLKFVSGIPCFICWLCSKKVMNEHVLKRRRFSDWVLNFVLNFEPIAICFSVSFLYQNSFFVREQLFIMSHGTRSRGGNQIIGGIFKSNRWKFFFTQCIINNINCHYL